ncbi:transposable element Tcb1 transposase [Trichonephila clavipes]|nr:transposable element Tcb1 transposase [Trichonephila clavipes]
MKCNRNDLKAEAQNGSEISFSHPLPSRIEAKLRFLILEVGIDPNWITSRRKRRSTFDQVSEFDRGKIVVYRYCGLTFREIGSSVGRNQTTAMRIYDRRMQEVMTDRRGRSHPPQCTTSREDRQFVRMAVMDRSVT